MYQLLTCSAACIVNGYVSQYGSDLKTGQQHDALQAIALELPNILWAWQWALTQRDSDTPQIMLPGLALFYEMQSRFQEGKDLFQHAVAQLSRSKSGSFIPSLLPQLIVQHAVFAKYLVYGQDVSSLYQGALPLVAHQQTPELALTYIHVGWLQSWHSLKPCDDAESWVEKGKRLADEKGDTWEVARAMFVQGEIFLWTHADDRAAERMYHQSLELRQRIGDQWGQAAAFNALGQIAHRAGLYQKAQWWHREALRVCEALCDLHGIAWSKGRLAEIATDLGEYHEAWTLNWEAYRLATHFGNQVISAWRLSNLGEIAFEQGDYGQAVEYVQQSRMRFQTIHHPWGPAAAMLQLGRILSEQGYLDEAERLIQESLALFGAAHNTFGETSALFQLGVLYHIQGDQSTAFESMCKAIRVAHEKQYLLNLLRWLGKLGHLLGETAEGMQILSFVAHHPATPYDAKKHAHTTLKFSHSKPKNIRPDTSVGKPVTLNEMLQILLQCKSLGSALL